QPVAATTGELLVARLGLPERTPDVTPCTMLRRGLSQPVAATTGELLVARLGLPERIPDVAPRAMLRRSLGQPVPTAPGELLIARLGLPENPPDHGPERIVRRGSPQAPAALALELGVTRVFPPLDPPSGSPRPEAGGMVDRLLGTRSITGRDVCAFGLSLEILHLDFGDLAELRKQHGVLPRPASSEGSRGVSALGLLKPHEPLGEIPGHQRPLLVIQRGEDPLRIPPHPAVAIEKCADQ